MSKPNKRWLGPYLAAVTAISVCGWLVWAGNAPSPAPVSTTGVPTQLGLWSGTVIETDPRTIEILETEDVALREFQLGNGPPVWFAQVSGFGQRAAYHPPEVCYIGSHFEVLEREEMPVFINGQEQDVMRLVLAQDGLRYVTWYWFTAGERRTPNYYKQQLWLVWNTVKRNPVSGKLIRISTILDEPAAANRRLLAFVASLDRQSLQLVRNDLY
mgnify:CR=1 FL=1